MTLMEAVVALVILSLAAIGCLELAQGASQLEFSATQWNAAVSVAESRMALATVGASNLPDRAALALNARAASREDGTQVTRESWRAGLDLITVTVPVVDGKSFVLQRLVPARTVRPVPAAP